MSVVLAQSMSRPGVVAQGEWNHRGCIVRWGKDSAGSTPRFAICHSSGLPMGQAGSLDEARQLIDEGIQLVRQRLAATP